MVRVIMNLNNYAEEHGMKIIFTFVFIDLKKEIKKDILFVMKVKKNLYRISSSEEGVLIIIKVVFNLKQKRFGKFKRVSLVKQTSR